MSTISSEDRGFTLGDGVFDTALALGGTVFARARHVERLLAATDTLGIAVARGRIEQALDGAVSSEPTIIRTTVTRGTAARGLWPASAGEPTVVTATSPWSPALLGAPARLVTVRGRRNEFSPTASLKTLGYLDHILAAREAAQAGVEDALILNTQGRIACTTIANVFVLRGTLLVTPPLAEGCLPGILRALTMEVAAEAGLEVVQAPLSPTDLLAADAAFATNSVRFLRRLTALDGSPLRNDTAVTAALEQALFARVIAECGVDPRAA